MPTVWGSWVSSGGIKFRVGLEYSVSGTKIHISRYMAGFQGYYINDNSATLTRTGSLGGTINFPFVLNGNGSINIPGSSGTISGSYGKSYTFGGKITNLPVAGTATVSATVNIPSGLPSAPGKPTISATGSTSIALTWNAPSNTGGSPIKEYAVDYYLGSSISGTATTIAGITSRSRTITGLASGTTYTFRIRARNANGWGAWSSSATAKTKPGMYVNKAGVWVRAEPWVNHNGVWKRATPLVRTSSGWVPTI